MNSLHFHRFVFALLLIASAVSAAAQDTVAPPVDGYQLSVRDLVHFAVLDESETVLEQRIDGQGRIRIPYLGNIEVAGLTIREAEEKLEEAYLKGHIYHKLQVMVRVLEYSVKEAAVLGQVAKPGNVKFPIEMNELDIREVISQAGGFTNISQSREVRITRMSDIGEEQVFTVDVDRMLSGRGERDGKAAPTFYVRPGDVIFVPERLF